jgi:hypothetical protein
MRIRRLVPALAAVLAGGVLAAPAHAGLLVESAPSCAPESLEQEFLPWLDPAYYTLAPGGRAESTDGWSALDGAEIVDGNEPWKVAGDGDSHSLRLGAGDSATTDTACVGIDHPTLRFFARSKDTGLLSLLKVDVTAETALGVPVTLPAGVVLPTGGAWTPTLPMLLAPSLLPLLPGEMTPVRFTFTPVGRGTWNIDDVHVDPHRRT